MYRLDVSDKADNDLDRILSYIAEDLAAPQAAASFANEVYGCFILISSSPVLFVVKSYTTAPVRFGTGLKRQCGMKDFIVARLIEK